MVDPAAQRPRVQTPDSSSGEILNTDLPTSAKTLFAADNQNQQDLKVEARINKLLDLTRSAVSRGDFKVALEVLDRIERALDGDPSLLKAIPLKINPHAVRNPDRQAADDLITRALKVSNRCSSENKLATAAQIAEVAAAAASGEPEFRLSRSTLNTLSADELTNVLVDTAARLFEAAPRNYRHALSAFELIASIFSLDARGMHALQSVREAAKKEQEKIAAQAELDRRSERFREAARALLEMPREIEVRETKLKTLAASTIAQNKLVESSLAERDDSKGLLNTINAEIERCSGERDALEQTAALRTDQAAQARSQKEAAERELADLKAREQLQ